MALENDRVFGVRALSEAINVLPKTPSVIRDLGIFKPVFLTTTTCEVEYREGAFNLVPAVERGTGGVPVPQKQRRVHSFRVPHFPVDDRILAEDVQNVRAFGTDNKLTAVVEVVNDKLSDAKANLEYTREHLMLGALLGKVLDKDGDVLCDIHTEFGVTPASYNWALSNANTEVAKEIDKTKTAQGKFAKGEPNGGAIVLASPEFMQALIYHKSVKDLYLRYQEAASLRADSTHIEFKMKGVHFIQYDETFDGDVNIAAGEAIWLPHGTRQVFREFFAPADMNATVNTKALQYYALREKLPMDKGWAIHAQTNALPLVLRPQMVCKITAAA